MVKAGTVNATDLKLFLVTDDLNEAIEHIRKHAIEEFRLMRKAAAGLTPAGRGRVSGDDGVRGTV